LAKRAIDLKDLKEAEKQLRFVLTQKTDDGLKSIATLRLASVLAEAGDTKAALAALNGDTNPAFIPSREELRGDLLKQTGDVAGAQKAYQAAAKVLVERQEPRPVLEMKMADVGLEAPEIKRASPIKEAS
jgi:predicted negative regulator of RcsB-dependent stress response